MSLNNTANLRDVHNTKNFYKAQHTVGNPGHLCDAEVSRTNQNLKL